MKQQQCYIKTKQNTTKPKGKTNKRLKTCPGSTTLSVKKKPVESD